MENQKTEEEKECFCPCPWKGGRACEKCWHGKWYGYKHFWLRWIVAIIILIAVFSIGVKVGEFKSMIDGQYNNGFGRGSYRNERNPMMFYRQNDEVFNKNFGPGMMQEWNQQYQQQVPNSVNVPAQ